LDTPRH
jgi:hypothetical protein